MNPTGKRSPEMRKLDEMLRTSRISSTGFLGTDTRPVEEIIARDLAAVKQSGFRTDQIAQRMRFITDQAKQGIETDVVIEPGLSARATHTRGRLPCPWPHPGLYAKTVTHVRRTGSQAGEIKWSDLSIHLIEAHGFFQGKGADFRLNPSELIEIIFNNPQSSSPR
mgnify:CR=1 FL=1